MKLNVVGKNRETHANADTRISSTSLTELSASVVERISRRHAERQPIFTSLGSNRGPRNYDFSPFPPLFSFFCHIQTFFYINMNIFIILLENVNKSRTSANNLSLIVYTVA
jgi:hypothetical protein